MSVFVYKGRDGAGRAISGQVEAGSVEAAASALASRGVTPITINEQSSQEGPLAAYQQLWLRRRVEAPEMIMFCRQMYTITKAGIPLVKGIRSLAASLKHYTLQQTLLDVAERLETGQELSRSMSAHPKVFNHLFIALVDVGENSGRLDLTFLQLAEYIERDLETSRNIRQALRYPTFVVIALAIAMAVINIKVIPAFAGMFRKFGAELPLPTRILIAVSDFMVAWWPYLLVAIIAAGIGVWRFGKTERGGRLWGRKKLRLPIIGDVIERASMARYARTFALMVKAGMPLTSSLDLCARAIDNPHLAEKIKGIRSGVERGEGLYTTHMASGMFTPLVLQMISVGEESGQVDTLLAEVAGFYEREVDYDVKKLSDKIEPVLIIIMAVFVLILALGIFLPMWEMHNIQK